MPRFILILDASNIYEFQTCPLKWYYRFQKNLQLNTFTKPAADKGTLVHSLLDIYYNYRANEPKENKLVQANLAIEIFKKSNETKKLFPDCDIELENFICNRFLLYVQRWIDDDFFVLKKDENVGVEVGFSKLLYEDNEVKFIVEGRIDLINIINSNILAWTDHKTQSRVSELYNYKPQFKTYAWATKYDYGIINYFGMQEKFVEGKTFRRNLISFPKWMIDEWEEKMLEIFWQITTLIYKNPNPEESIYILRNDSACAGAFDSNPCQFTHICEIGDWEMKKRIKEYKYNEVEKWSPWKL